MRDIEQLLRRLAEAESRIYDVVCGEFGHAFKEADRYLKQYRPDLYELMLAKKGEGKF